MNKSALRDLIEKTSCFKSLLVFVEGRGAKEEEVEEEEEKKS